MSTQLSEQPPGGPERVRVATLVIDESLAPRGLDQLHVRNMTDALENGDTLPRITVDSASRRIVDGRHRTEATRRVFGHDAWIEVEWQTYESDVALWQAAVEANAQHGRGYSAYEQRKIVLQGQEFGVPLERISSLLHIPVEKLERRSAVGYILERRGAANDIVRRPIPLKRSLAHLDGNDLTPIQYEANKKASGMKPGFHARQLMNLIDSGEIAFYLLDHGTTIDLAELRDALNQLSLPASAEPEVAAG